MGLRRHRPPPGSPGCAPSAPTTPGGARRQYVRLRLGTGLAGFSGDGGPATRAAPGQPTAVAADGTGLVFADQITSRIRQVTG
jgi:hypothetical protein